MDVKWRTVITAKAPFWRVDFKEIWRYRDLCFAFIKKNYITRYKQTVFGPLYMVLSPLLTSGLFSVIFGKVAEISTDGAPDFLFYMAGNLLWSFFSACMSDNMYVLSGNSHIMGKVYFPRLIIPISNVVTRMISSFLQAMLFVIMYLIFMLRGHEMSPNVWLCCVPVWFIQTALLGMGLGLMISALTVRYRDLSVITSFAIQLLMYATPIIYPVSSIKGSLRTIALCNPIAPVVEGVRYAVFGQGTFSPLFLCISFMTTVLVVVSGVLMFNKAEKTFIDTI